MTVLSREYMLTTINYANIFLSKISSNITTLSDIYNAYQLLDLNQRSYLS